MKSLKTNLKLSLCFVLFCFSFSGNQVRLITVNTYLGISQWSTFYRTLYLPTGYIYYLTVDVSMLFCGSTPFHICISLKSQANS